MVANWREIARVNRKKTHYVILSFVVIYLFLGAFIAILFSPYAYNVDLWPSIVMLESSINIISGFMLFAIVCVLFSVLFGAKFSLSGLTAELITEGQQDKQCRQLFHVVEEMRIASGMRINPKIYVISADYMNAFAAGWSEKDAIVAITRPLLDVLSREELQAVMAHELAHIQHADTRVLTVVSTLSGLAVWVVDCLFRSVLYGGSSRRRSNNQRGGGLALVVIIALRVLLPIITALLVMYVSRSREMMADAGCVKMTRNGRALAQALVKIHQSHKTAKLNKEQPYSSTMHNSLRSMSFMYSPAEAGVGDSWDIASWFSTHPSLAERLKALNAEDLL